MVIEGIDINPLHGSEWREDLAVVESSSGPDWIVGWGPHHWGLDHSLCLVSVVLILHIVPDPEWTSIVWTFVVANHEFLADRVVSFESSWAGVCESPVEGLLVDVTTSISNLIGFVEVSIFATCSLLHCLS
jgi:hypothetical protein